MNQLILLISIILWSNIQCLYINDKLIRVIPLTNEHINYLEKLEVNSTIDFWTDIISFNKSIDIHIRANEFEKYIKEFKDYLLPYEILIDNLQKLIDYEEQIIKQDHLKRQFYNQIKKNIVGTYVSYNEMIEFIQDKANINPMNIKIIDLGPTFQGRRLKTISLQYNPLSTRNIWIDCGIHARGIR